LHTTAAPALSLLHGDASPPALALILHAARKSITHTHLAALGGGLALAAVASPSASPADPSLGSSPLPPELQHTSHSRARVYPQRVLSAAATDSAKFTADTFDALVADDGTFLAENVPAGAYTLTAYIDAIRPAISDGPATGKPSPIAKNKSPSPRFPAASPTNASTSARSPCATSRQK
jgi:hypothetical protein